MRTHYAAVVGHAACGKKVSGYWLTSEAVKVDCQSCWRTAAYADAEEQTKVVKTVPSTPEETAVVIGTVAAGVAEDWGHCSEFDDMVEEINNRLPDGIRIPGRKRTWVVSLKDGVRVSATSSSEAIVLALDRIEADGASRHYVAVSD